LNRHWIMSWIWKLDERLNFQRCCNVNISKVNHHWISMLFQRHYFNRETTSKSVICIIFMLRYVSTLDIMHTEFGVLKFYKTGDLWWLTPDLLWGRKLLQRYLDQLRKNRLPKEKWFVLLLWRIHDQWSFDKTDKRLWE
jgi:hypothetical protein